MSVNDVWHHASTEAAQAAGVTMPCECKGLRRKRYPTKRHGRGKQWRVHHRIGGREVTRSFTLKGDADDYNTVIDAQLVQGVTPFDPTRGRMLFRTFVAEWLAIHQYAPSSYSTNLGYVDNHLNPFLGDTPIGKIEHSTVVAWLAWMRTKPNPRSATGEPYSPATVELVYILLCTIMKAAVHDRRIEANPCGDIAYPKAPDPPELTVWEAEVVDTMLAAVPHPHSALLLLAAHCGHRQGEAFAVAAQDIRDGEIVIHHQVQRVNGTLTLTPPKHGSVRVAPLPDDVAVALDLHLQQYPTISLSCTCPRRDHRGKMWTLLFSDELPGYATARGPAQGRPLLAAQWNKRIWHPVLAAAKLDPADSEATGIHGLRHYCVSEWIAGGATLTEVQKWVGHKSVATTERIYAHLFKRAKERGRTIMDGVFARRRQRGLRVVKDA